MGFLITDFLLGAAIVWRIPFRSPFTDFSEALLWYCLKTTTGYGKTPWWTEVHSDCEDLERHCIEFDSDGAGKLRSGNFTRYYWSSCFLFLAAKFAIYLLKTINFGERLTETVKVVTQIKPLCKKAKYNKMSKEVVTGSTIKRFMDQSRNKSVLRKTISYTTVCVAHFLFHHH